MRFLAAALGATLVSGAMGAPPSQPGSPLPRPTPSPSRAATAPGAPGPVGAEAQVDRAPGPRDATGNDIRVEIEGDLARVTVVRALPTTVNGHLEEGLLDVALPVSSALLDAAVVAGGKETPLAVTTIDGARDLYVESLRAMGLSAERVAYDDEATHRIRVARKSTKRNDITSIKYSFSTLLEADGDRMQLAFPGAPEATPVPARVSVSVAPRGRIASIIIGGAVHPVGSAERAAATDVVSTRHRWLVALAPAEDKRDAGPTPLARAALARDGRRAASSGPPLTCTVGLPSGAEHPLPERVLFVFDRSRSVGPAGLSAQGVAARRLLEALPPSTRFQVLFFDRATAPLFPLPRTATREALAALEDELVPIKMANGTNLDGALHTAGELLRRTPSEFGPATLLVLLTDGAVGRVGTKAGLGQELGAVPGVALMTAVLSVRPDDDPAVSRAERGTLRTLAAVAPLGGVEREVRLGELNDTIPALLDALRHGGDAFSIALETGASTLPIADSIAPGAGVSGLLSLPSTARRSPPALRLVYARAGQTHRVALAPRPVDPRWLAPHLGPRSFSARAVASLSTVAMLEPVVRPVAAAESPGPSGYMERSVVRDALSIAFTPRARACYLNRSGATPAERELTGRVRLALDLVRGEVGAARIESSTLGRPAIETCLREAAFALEVPRAYRNDEPVTAILNLSFRPRTPPDKKADVDPGVNSQLDLLVEEALKANPVPPDLLEKAGASSTPAPPPPAKP